MSEVETRTELLDAALQGADWGKGINASRTRWEVTALGRL